MRLRKAGLSGFPVISYLQNRSISPKRPFFHNRKPMQKGDIAAVQRDPKDKTLRLQEINPMNRMVASRLFLDGTHREAVGAVVDAQRVDVRRAEAQAMAVARRVRHGRPEVAEAADVVHRARRVAAIAQSRKEDRTARSVVAPLARHLVTIKLPTEIIGKIGGGGIGRIESGAEVRRPGNIAAVIRKARKGVRRRQMVADGRRIVNRLNHRIVVSRRHRIVAAPKIGIGRGAPIVDR